MENIKKDLSIKQIYDDFILNVTLDEDELKVLDMYIKKKKLWKWLTDTLD